MLPQQHSEFVSGTGNGVFVSGESESVGTIDLVQSLRRAVYNKQASDRTRVAKAAITYIPALSIEAAKPAEPKWAAVDALLPEELLADDFIEPVTPIEVEKITWGIGSIGYTAMFMAVFLVGMCTIWYENQKFAPEMYADGGMAPAAEAHANNQNYAVFDLNINIRALREEQLKRMTKTPDVIILGASQWQEAHKNLLRGVDFYNAHIHRDYWEDLPGMVELLTRYNRLPKKLIIAIRDRQFKPLSARQDWLWEPGIPNYRAMTQRLGIETESYIKTLPYHRAQALISLPMLFENVTRWFNAPVYPGPTIANRMATMDLLLPDGSIEWSTQKKAQVFTPQRTASEVDTFVKANINDPPLVDQKGVEAFVAVLDYLKAKGVSVYLVNPPFNPDFYDRIQGTPYADGLARIQALVNTIATEHDLPLIGSFNPHKVGCTADMYIDAEHSNPTCLQKIFDEFLATETKKDAV